METPLEPKVADELAASRVAQQLSQRLQSWRRQLLDTSKRTRLINCKFGRTGVLAIEHPQTERLWERFAVDEAKGRFVWPSELVTDLESLAEADAQQAEAEPTAPVEAKAEADVQVAAPEPETIATETPAESSEVENEKPSDVVAEPAAPAPAPVEAEPADPVAPAPRVWMTEAQLKACITSDALRNDDLLTRLIDKGLESRLKRLSVTAAASLTEQGVNSLFLAFGFLKWFETSSSENALYSPLLLLPVSLYRQSSDSPWELRAVDDDIVPNYSLAELMRTEHRLALPELDDETLRASVEGLTEYFRKVTEAVTGHERWEVESTVALGTFGFQKVAMWEDLKQNEGRIMAHALCRGIAGDMSVAGEVSGAGLGNGSASSKEQSADSEHLILDCDSSQQSAVRAVLDGSHLMMDGPPGTGKSQTISNMIAECLAVGKKVLFVSEKAAALEVVKRRLDANRLGDFCLECHSSKSNKRVIVEELGRCLTQSPERYASQDAKLAELERSRVQLNAYVKALHLPRLALNKTAFAIHGQLAAISTKVTSRLQFDDVRQVNRDQLREMEEAISRLKLSGDIIAAGGVHPWRGCSAAHAGLSFADDVRFHFKRAADGYALQMQAAEPLVALGFLQTDYSLVSLKEARVDGEAALSYPAIPAKWKERGAQKTADDYLKLQAFADEYQQASAALVGYRDEALEQADVATMESARSVMDAVLPKLIGVPDDVRGVVDFLATVRSELRAAIEQAQAIRLGTDQLNADFGVARRSNPTVQDARQLSAAVEALQLFGRIGGELFDPAARARLRKTAAECQQIAALLQAARGPLGDRLLPVAYMPVSGPIVTEVLRYQSWFKRWFGGWRRAKQAMASLYAKETPSSARQWLDDAHHLTRAHQLLANLTERCGNDAAVLGWDGSIDFDWSHAVNRVVALEAIPKEISDQPAYRALASGQTPITTIASAGSAVARGLDELSKLLDALRAKIQLWQMPGQDAQQNMELVAGAEGLGQLAESVDHAERVLQSTAVQLQPGAQVRLAQLGHDANLLRDLRQKHAAGAALAADLGETLNPLASRSVGAWPDQVKLATWLVALFEARKGKPVEHLIALMADPSRVQQLRTGLEALNKTDTPELTTSWEYIGALFDTDVEVSDGIILNDAPMTDLLEWLDERVADVLRSDEWFNYLSAGRLLENNGLAVLRDEVVSGAVPVEAMRDVFRGRFYRQWLDEAYRDEPALREFDLTVQEQALAKFQQLDRTWITNGFSRIRPPLLARLPQAKDLQGNIPETSEIGVLQRELNKKRRHLPLRRLFAAIPNLLPRLKPCMMMSPLAVSTYLNSEHIKFDVVIFDEASQVRPHDAICAIYRGAQLVVGGDQKQLPPTNFFERMAAGEEGEEQDALEQNTNDYESILDVCATLGVRRERLKWHYRSRRESLIAFSNRYFYNGDLVTFPSVKDVGNASGVGFDYVAEAVWTGGGVNLIEAQRLADAVMTHAAERPNKTLGVITMNQKQQMLLIDEIDKRRRANPKLEPFFGQDKLDPFFVKNLENVQGDERDYIFLGVGFAKNPQTGQLSHNFGPLNQQGGERRLNVAVTRAREALMVFSSIRAGDIDLRRTQSDGARLLRDYLDFAERGTGALQSAAAKQSGIELDTTFESEVERSLRERGLQVARQVGCSEYRIDLALLDPEVPGAYVLGIECDGESYNSSATARDRDRLRHQVLENLGWRLVRVWSTDWVRNPDRQIERIIMAYQDALKAKLAPPKKEDKEPPAKVVEPLSPAKPAREKKAREIVYESIDEVPDEDLVESAQTLLGKFGSMELDDLMLAVARQFGFQRTGTRIRQRLMAIILACVDRKILERDQTRIHLRKDEGMA